jgi:hypothetical protein
MKKEARDGFNALAISILGISAIAVNAYIDKSGK